MNVLRAAWAALGSGEPLPRGWRAIAVAVVGASLLAAPWTGVAGGVDVAARVLLLAAIAAGQDLVTGRGGVVMPTLGVYAVLGGTGVAVAAGRFGAGPFVAVLGALAALVAVLAIELLLAVAACRIGRRSFALASLVVAVLLPLFGSTTRLLQDGAPIAIGRVRFADVGLAVVAIGLWLLSLRFAHSPFGRVLPALRDDPRLAETLGYRPASYRTVAGAMAAGIAVLAGAAFALRQQSSEALVAGSADLVPQVLLVGVVGGFGTAWAAPVGAAVVLAAWRLLPALLLVGAGRVPDLPWLASLLSDPASQRWVVAAIIGVAGWAAGGLMKPRPPDC